MKMGLVREIDQEGFKVVSFNHNFALFWFVIGPLAVQPGAAINPVPLEMFNNNMQGGNQPVQDERGRQNRYIDHFLL